MKKRLLSFAIIVLTLIGCGDKKQTPQNIALEEVVTAFINSHPLPANTPQTLIDDAQSLIMRSENNGYGLINSKELFALLEQNTPVQIIDSSSEGNYLLGHIQNAKNIEFDSQSGNANGEMIWNAKITQEAFVKKLGNDKEKLIVFYDIGDLPMYQASPASNACKWAKKLGYNNVYKLIGGLKAWKERGYPLTQEKPKCCNH